MGGGRGCYITDLWDWCFLCVSSSALLVLMLCAAVLKKMKAAKKKKNEKKKLYFTGVKRRRLLARSIFWASKASFEACRYVLIICRLNDDTSFIINRASSLLAAVLAKSWNQH